ncbi:MAG: DinB family protein, partial [Gemmataceae bacterium]
MPVVAAPEANLLAQFAQVRRQTMDLVTPLSAEDMMVQAAPHASPTKWHLAHTTWFFETFLLMEQPGYEPFDPGFAFLFNSYYNALGERIVRSHRSLLSRPSLDEVFRYRDHVDSRMQQMLTDSEMTRDQRDRILIGLNHEQQHQELILTDIKQAFGDHPLHPAYRKGKSSHSHPEDGPATWIGHPGGLVSIGHVGSRFAYDNESPRHQVFLRPFRLSSALVTCGDYLEFIQDDGYARPELWLSDGWDA